MLCYIHINKYWINNQSIYYKKIIYQIKNKLEERIKKIEKGEFLDILKKIGHSKRMMVSIQDGGEVRELEDKTPVYRNLQENEAWFRKQCANCADIKLRPMYLGEKAQVPCLAIHLEVTVGNLMLEESMLGRLFQKLQEVSEVELRECLEKNELGISDADPLETLEDGMRAMLAGNLILLVDGFEKILKIGSKGYPGRSVSSAQKKFCGDPMKDFLNL